jgi:ABC-type transport system involved in multi-copper enzyme maturation permease subunit
MMAEVTRFRKRFMSLHGSSTAINGGIGIVLVLYALFAISCVYYRGDFDPLMLLALMLILLFFAIPLMLHASISGERERRSWEMLLVAPITHAQIVVGKFMGAFAGMSTAFGLFLIPVLIDALFSPDAKFVTLVLGCLVILAQGASLIAMTLLISSRVKRPLIALAVSIGVVMIYFFLVPGLISTGNSFQGNFFQGVVSPLKALEALSRFGKESNGNSTYESSIDSVNMFSIVFTHIAYQAVLTVSFLVWATKTLVFADHEVKFIPKKKNHA